MAHEEGRRVGYTNLSRREIAAMLVHCTYFRDVNSRKRPIRAFANLATTVLRFKDRRAEDYGRLYWKPFEWQGHMPKESVLTSLRVAFFCPNDNTPKLVIALRGTLLFFLNDCKDDIRISQETLGESERVEKCQTLIVKVIDHFLTEHPGSLKDICLAGHSLGAGIALLVGKHLAASGKLIDTHLFAPPLLPLTSIVSGQFLPEKRTKETQEWKHFSTDIRNRVSVSHVGEDDKHSGIGDAANAFVEITGKKALDKEWEDFRKLRAWFPHIYLNPEDVISLQYIKLYKELMQVSATRANVHISEQGIWTRLCGGDAKYISNVVPSANLYTSTKYTGKQYGNLKVHSLRQWHRFTDEDIGLKEFKVCLLPQPKEFEPGPLTT